MYAYFKGIVQEIFDDHIVLECNNIGYNIFVPTSVFESIDSVGLEIKIYTYTSVREDAFVLYGFSSKDDLELFKKLITVNGIGPKGALAILSTFTSDTLRFAIMAGDVKLISTAPGIGKKTAERLIIDLKDKVGGELPIVAATMTKEKTVSLNPNKQEAIEAMIALGYNQTDATKAVNSVDITMDMDAGQILKLALRSI